jgi:serine/threonine protein kinase
MIPRIPVIQDMVGQTISHYRIDSKLGEGGMGVVYRGEDTRLGRPVALKFLASHLTADEQTKKRFIREARAAASLDHPNIATVFDIDDDAGTVFLAMALVEGRTVKEIIEERPLKLKDLLDIAAQTAAALQAAHQHGAAPVDTDGPDRRRHAARYAGVHVPGTVTGAPNR